MITAGRRSGLLTAFSVLILFAAYGPSRLELSLPEVLKTTRFLKIALWQWIGFAVILLAGWLLLSIWRPAREEDHE